MNKLLIFSFIIAVSLVSLSFIFSEDLSSNIPDHRVEISSLEISEGLADRLLGISPEEERSIVAFLDLKEIQRKFYPSGIPIAYGKELDISFDNVQDAINKVSRYDLTFGSKRLSLDHKEMERYAHIGMSISCEYCCGVDAITRSNGEAACACEHSQMMRGLTAYLIKEHPKMTNDDILGELLKWKIQYFPKQMLSKFLSSASDIYDYDVEAIMNEFPDFLPEMVGDC